MPDETVAERNRPSEESTAEQLQLARAQGDAYATALRAMSEMDSHGRVKRAGDYLIGYEVEAAEGMYVRDGSALRWQAPQQENAHLEVVVRDADDGRFIPGLRVHARLTDSEGHDAGTHHLPFLWHPWLYHYGRNVQVPVAGVYSLHIHIDPPDFPRHDKVNGRRYADAVDVDFAGVSVETGRKG